MHALIIEDEFLTAQQSRTGCVTWASRASPSHDERKLGGGPRAMPDLITSDVELLRDAASTPSNRFVTRTLFLSLHYWVIPRVRERCPWAIIIQKPFGMADLREAVKEARRAVNQTVACNVRFPPHCLVTRQCGRRWRDPSWEEHIASSALFRMSDKLKLDEATKVSAKNGEVILDGPDGVDVKLTPEAAQKRPRLVEGAAKAAGQRKLRDFPHQPR